MTLQVWFAAASMLLSIAAIVVAFVWARRIGRAERRLARARSLLANAAAAELSAVRSGEIGAFDRVQREEIAAFLKETC